MSHDQDRPSSLSLSETLLDRLAEQAEKNGLSLEQAAEQAIETYLAQEEDFARTVVALEEEEEARPFLACPNVDEKPDSAG